MRRRSTHSNRGIGLEKMITLFGARYMSSGKAYLIKHEPPVKHLKSLKFGQFVAVRQAKGQPDYMILFDGKSVLFDAKEFAGKRFPFSSLHRHQFDALMAFERSGGYSALFLRSTDENGYFVLPLSAFKLQYMNWDRCRQVGEKSKKGQASLSLTFIRENAIQWDENGYLSAVSMLFG
tara:strand:+ start:6332 stop:6865 length:534 start_codon:yes stop_codon:yes gene_type:complete